MQVRLRGVKPVRKRLADGSVRFYHYHRATGRRLDGEPGSVEFIKSLADAASHQPRRVDTVAELVRAYKVSTAYTKRAAKTQKDYDRYLSMIVAEFGDIAVEDLNDRQTSGHFLEWRDRMAATPRTADYAITVAALLLSWALKRGKLDVNRLANVEKLYAGDRSELIWTPDKMAAFESAAYPELLDAFHFAIYTMQRESDVVRFGRMHVKDGRFRIRQQKTKVIAVGPVLAPVQSIIDRAPKTGRTTYLGSRNGQPWKLDHLRHEFRKACLKADLGEMHFHDTRGTAITMAVSAGWDAGRIASMSGLTLTESSRIIEAYFGRGALDAAWPENPYRTDSGNQGGNRNAQN